MCLRIALHNDCVFPHARLQDFQEIRLVIGFELLSAASTPGGQAIRLAMISAVLHYAALCCTMLHYAALSIQRFQSGFLRGESKHCELCSHHFSSWRALALRVFAAASRCCICLNTTGLCLLLGLCVKPPHSSIKTFCGRRNMLTPGQSKTYYFWSGLSDFISPLTLISKTCNPKH